MADVLILTHIDYCPPAYLAQVLQARGCSFDVLRVDLGELLGYDLERPKAVALTVSSFRAKVCFRLCAWIEANRVRAERNDPAFRELRGRREHRNPIPRHWYRICLMAAVPLRLTAPRESRG